jgi:hypothetical protein
MFARLQDAAMYQRLKAATGGSSVEMKGYSKVGTEDFRPDGEEDDDIGSVEYWTSSEVCAYLRERLLEYEGADEETVTDLLFNFEDRKVRKRKTKRTI